MVTEHTITMVLGKWHMHCPISEQSGLHSERETISFSLWIFIFFHSEPASLLWALFIIVNVSKINEPLEDFICGNDDDHDPPAKSIEEKSDRHRPDSVTIHGQKNNVSYWWWW